jgi:hypothetical protein
MSEKKTVAPVCSLPGQSRSRHASRAKTNMDSGIAVENGGPVSAEIENMPVGRRRAVPAGPTQSHVWRTPVAVAIGRIRVAGSIGHDELSPLLLTSRSE